MFTALLTEAESLLTTLPGAASDLCCCQPLAQVPAAGYRSSWSKDFNSPCRTSGGRGQQEQLLFWGQAAWGQAWPSLMKV